MGEKTITIPEETYERLLAARRSDENVADVVERLLTEEALADHWGAWSDDTAEEARAAIEKSRERTTRRVETLIDDRS